MIILWFYLVIINVVAFTAFVIDKLKAQKHQYRIPERVLLGLCLIGGSIGGLFAMYMVHHKTRKREFSVGVPVMLVIQFILVYAVTHIA